MFNDWKNTLKEQLRRFLPAILVHARNIERQFRENHSYHVLYKFGLNLPPSDDGPIEPFTGWVECNLLIKIFL